MRRVLIAIGLVVALAVVAFVQDRKPAHAENIPYVPGSESAVVAELPARAEGVKDLERLRKASAAAPQDEALATAYARACIGAWHKTGDPRFLGQARAGMGELWTRPRPSTEALVLRATIKQSLHDFEGALADLAVVERIAPEDAQATLTRATIQFVTGRYDSARQSCAELARSGASAVAAATCLGAVDSVTGSAKRAYEALATRLDQAGDREERAWATSTLGEIAMRMGDDALAERHYRGALTLDPDDRYTRAALADLLLDTGRAKEVEAVVGERPEDDGLLLRLAIARTRLGDKRATELVETLGRRHDASAARGDVVHRREQARFELELRKSPARALELATANFEVQKEPADVRIFFEAALAAKRPEAAAPGVAFFRGARSEEPRLRALAKQLEP